MQNVLTAALGVLEYFLALVPFLSEVDPEAVRET